MPPRLNSTPPRDVFYPPNDINTHRDLLLFEERLKSNYTSLNRRKRRYQVFLAQLLLIILFLLSEVFLRTEFLAVPCQWLLRLIVDEGRWRDLEHDIHHYLALGLLCVFVTTLGLFFVSGMYSEKIEYANRYVPHVNRALRQFNMFLNVRQPPLQTKLPFNPFSFLFARTPSTPPSPTIQASPRRRSPSPNRISKRSSSVPIAPIPPSSNPRGELIFSSRVDRSFRDGYDRHRQQFDRKRDERERQAYQATWLGWLYMKLSRAAPIIPQPAIPSGTTTPIGLGRSGSAGSMRGRGGVSLGGTPSSSRRSSPVPRRASRMRPGGTRGGTPPSAPSPPAAVGDSPRREVV